MYLALLFHYISDWLLQPRAVGRNKSSSWKWMSIHLIIIYACWTVFCFITGTFFYKALINTILHGIIDKSIWWTFRKYRIPSDQYQQKEFLVYNKFAEDPLYFWLIGLDQMLHVMILFWLFG